MSMNERRTEDLIDAPYNLTKVSKSKFKSFKNILKMTVAQR